MRIVNQNKTGGYGIPSFFRPWSANVLVSVGQTTRQRINYFNVNETISVSEHRALIY